MNIYRGASKRRHSSTAAWVVSGEVKKRRGSLPCVRIVRNELPVWCTVAWPRAKLARDAGFDYERPSPAGMQGYFEDTEGNLWEVAYNSIPIFRSTPRGASRCRSDGPVRGAVRVLAARIHPIFSIACARFLRIFLLVS